MRKISIKKNAKILFTGDSITDSGRDKGDLHGLTGYSRIVCDTLGAVEGYNRGVNGECCRQILERMRGDCEAIKPDVISILAGINDTTKRGEPPYMAGEAEFYDIYRRILKTAREFTREIIVLEPFLITKDFGMDGLRTPLYERIYAIRRLAHEFGCAYVPLDGIFAESWIAASPSDYTPDCVHLTQAGKEIVAREWLKRSVFTD